MSLFWDDGELDIRWMFFVAVDGDFGDDIVFDKWGGCHKYLVLVYFEILVFYHIIKDYGSYLFDLVFWIALFYEHLMAVCICG